jgi:hypothetical protein
MKLSLRYIFEAPTIAQLAVAIEKAKEAHREFVPSKIEPISRGTIRVKQSSAKLLADEKEES